VKPGGKVGPWGPFRGRLGAHWWIAALVVGALLLAFGAWFLLQGRAPGPPWLPVAGAESVAPDEAREVGDGIFVGRLGDGRPVAVREAPGCPLEFTESRYRDCRGVLYFLNGQPEGEGRPLTPVPVQVHGGEIYVRL
jgi:hypothetical protein